MNGWKINKETQRWHTPIFDVVWHEKSNGEKTMDAVSLDSPSWVSALVYDTDKKMFLLVDEFRHGVNKFSLELPSGTIEKGETAEEAVVREVKEELGVENVEIVDRLFKGNPNTAFMSNSLTCFFVKVSGKQAQKLDENETLNIVELYLEEVLNGITDESPISMQLALARFMGNLVNYEL